MALALRRPRESDLPAIWALAQRMAAEAPAGWPAPERERVEEFARACANGVWPFWGWLLEAAGDPAGFVAGWFTPLTFTSAPEVLQVAFLYVVPEQRSRTALRMLLARCQLDSGGRALISQSTGERPEVFERLLRASGWARVGGTYMWTLQDVRTN